MNATIELATWQKVWRRGFAPLLSMDHLNVLAAALRDNDPRLIQGATTSPPPLQCVQDWPAEAACVLGLCGVFDNGGFAENPADAHFAGATVAEVEEFFAKACFDCDQILAEPAGCRHFLNWYDETPRDEMRRDLLAEVELEIERRKS